VQGLTGSEGRFHGLRNRAYGTNVVAGVTPGKGGQDVDGIPVFDTVAEAVADAGANTSLIFVPARFAPDAIYEAVDAGIGTVICITEHVPVMERRRLRWPEQAWQLVPGTPWGWSQCGAGIWQEQLENWRRKRPGRRRAVVAV
jgi:succinyl-CoA synthetase alpha subunit